MLKGLSFGLLSGEFPDNGTEGGDVRSTSGVSSASCLSPLSWVAPLSPSVAHSSPLLATNAPSVRRSCEPDSLNSTLASSWTYEPYQRVQDGTGCASPQALATMSPLEVSRGRFMSGADTSFNMTTQTEHNQTPAYLLDSSVAWPRHGTIAQASDNCASLAATLSSPERHNVSVTSPGQSRHVTTSLASSPLSSRCDVYQLSVSVPQLSDARSPGGVRSSASPSSAAAGGGVSDATSLCAWRQLDIDRRLLFQWTQNLRVWLSKTVFERLANEIDAINDSLRQHGLADVQIGEVGMERLRKTAELGGVASRLHSVLPFLSLSSHQQYLVRRIRELSEGGCLQQFRWDSGYGGAWHKDRLWNKHLPTDTAVVMHLWCVYLDCHLPARPSQPSGRAFSSEHLVNGDSSGSDSGGAGGGSGADRLVIEASDASPPHYSVMCGERRYQVEKGRNNVFHTLLLFLHLIRTNYNCTLDQIHLGESGLNLLWVINSPSSLSPP